METTKMRFILTLSIFITFLSSLGQAASLCEIQVLRLSGSVNNVVIIDHLRFDSNIEKTRLLSKEHQKNLNKFKPFLSRDLNRMLMSEAADLLGISLDGSSDLSSTEKTRLAEKMLELFKDYFLNREDLKFMAKNGDFPSEEVAEIFANADAPIFRRRTRQLIRKEKVRIAKHFRLRWPYFFSYKKMSLIAGRITGTQEKDLILQELFFESIDPFLAIRSKEIEFLNKTKELYAENAEITNTANGIGRNLMSVLSYSMLAGTGLGFMAGGGGSVSALFFLVPVGITLLTGAYAAALSFYVDNKVNRGLAPLNRELRLLHSQFKNNSRINSLANQAAHSYYLGIVNEESLNAIQTPDFSLTELNNSEKENLESHLLAIQLYLVNFVLISNQMRDRSFKVANAETPSTQSEAYSSILEIVKEMDEEMLSFWMERLRLLKTQIDTMEIKVLETGEEPLIEKVSDTRATIEKLTNILTGSNNDPLQLPFLQIDGITPESLIGPELEKTLAGSL